MATKKQKREAALAKREQFLADEKARGLAALESGRRSESKERMRMAEVAQRTNIRKRGTPVGPVEQAWRGDPESHS